MNKNNNNWLVEIPRLILSLFIILQIISMISYPGGTFFNPQSEGYSFTRNFLSDLGRTRSFSRDIRTTSRSAVWPPRRDWKRRIRRIFGNCQRHEVRCGLYGRYVRRWLSRTATSGISVDVWGQRERRWWSCPRFPAYVSCKGTPRFPNGSSLVWPIRSYLCQIGQQFPAP